MDDFLIVCWSDLYSGKWIVVRRRDMRLMTESRSVVECLRWVRTWGDSIGQRKKGIAISTIAYNRLS